MKRQFAGYLNSMDYLKSDYNLHRTILPLWLVFTFLVAATSGSAQGKYSVRRSAMTFTSDVELELITASTDKVQGLLDTNTSEFAFTVEISSFQGFNSRLQREHFNEKYMESDRFPKARFYGKIIEPVDFSANGTYDVRAKGDLEIHGRKQTRIIRSKLTVTNGSVRIQARFEVPLSDHNITIPAIVSQKIATEIEVAFEATMSPQEL